MGNQHAFDVLVIGSGAAGLSVALQLADYARVAVLSKDALAEGATLYAQGGVSAVRDACDSLESHVQDTLEAGAGLCHEEVVRYVVQNGPDSIQWLDHIGVSFTRQPGGSEYHLHQEGGHSHRRIVHAADSTGRAIETTLEEQARRHTNISLFEFHTAVDLITGRHPGGGGDRCLGAYVFDRKTGAVNVFRSRFTVLATGAPARCICTPVIRIFAPAMGSPWPGAPVVVSPTWNSFNFIQPVCFMRRRNLF